MEQKSFRYDIQGLRAIAVLAVIIFHIDPTKLPGGYLGVDMFFVISGFLITSHILKDLNNDAFSFKNFYLKRIRRLYPALLATIFVSTIFVCLLYLPSDAEKYAGAMMATATYVSNIFFYAQSDYFDASLQSNPLLHTWSLSVEEQFYIVLPILLFTLYRYKPSYIFPAILLLGAGSFILSEIILHKDPAAAFFMAPTRFGQFIAGGILAFLPRPNFASFLKEILSWACLLALAGFMFFYTEETAFPGFNSIAPTLCVALIIYAGANQNLFASRILSLKPAQIIGNASYSLYLWHWPIVVFYRYNYGDEILRWEKIYVLLACLGIGWLSYRFIEKPGLRMDIAKPYFLKATVAVTVMVLGMGVFMKYTDGLSQRYDDHIVKLASYLDYEIDKKDAACFLEDGDGSSFNQDLCLQPKSNKPTILLLGDSHAAHLYAGLKNVMANAEILQANSSGCRQLSDAKGEEKCLAFRKRLFDTMLPQYHYDTILVSHRWYFNEIDQIEPTINILKQFADTVIISGPVPEYKSPLPKLLVMNWNKDNRDQIVQNSQKDRDVKQLDNLVKQAALQAGVSYYSPYQTMCGEENCATLSADGVPLQFDYGHVTSEGATLLIKDMAQQNLFLLN